MAGERSFSPLPFFAACSFFAASSRSFTRSAVAFSPQLAVASQGSDDALEPLGRYPLTSQATDSSQGPGSSSCSPWQTGPRTRARTCPSPHSKATVKQAQQNGLPLHLPHPSLTSFCSGCSGCSGWAGCSGWGFCCGLGTQTAPLHVFSDPYCRKGPPKRFPKANKTMSNPEDVCKGPLQQWREDVTPTLPVIEKQAQLKQTLAAQDCAMRFSEQKRRTTRGR